MMNNSIKSTDRHGGGAKPNGFVVLLLVVALLSLSLKWIFHLDWLIAIIVVLFSLSVFAKFYLVFTNFTGHGVGVTKHKTPSGLPWYFGLLVILVVGLFVCSLYFAYVGLDGDTRNNVVAFFASGLIGLIGSIVYWFVFGYREFYFGSEYDARAEFKNKGYAPGEIDKKIQELKEKGILREGLVWVLLSLIFLGQTFYYLTIIPSPKL